MLFKLFPLRSRSEMPVVNCLRDFSLYLWCLIKNHSEMKIHCYDFEIVISCMAIYDMETEKKALVNFLKGFEIKPDVEKIKQYRGPNSPYYYEINASCESSKILKVFRFVESLQNFCRYWNLPLCEIGLSEREIELPTLPQLEFRLPDNE